VDRGRQEGVGKGRSRLLINEKKGEEFLLQVPFYHEKQPNRTRVHTFQKKTVEKKFGGPMPRELGKWWVGRRRMAHKSTNRRKNKNPNGEWD